MILGFMGDLFSSDFLIIVITFLIFPLSPVAFAYWGYKEGGKRTIGASTGLVLGLLLSFVGIIIVYCANEATVPNFMIQSPADELKKYKDLLNDGAITQEEFNIQKNRILNI